jgi:hypothetical protein
MKFYLIGLKMPDHGLTITDHGLKITAQYYKITIFIHFFFWGGGVGGWDFCIFRVFIGFFGGRISFNLIVGFISKYKNRKYNLV